MCHGSSRVGLLKWLKRLAASIVGRGGSEAAFADRNITTHVQNRYLRKNTREVKLLMMVTLVG